MGSSDLPSPTSVPSTSDAEAPALVVIVSRPIDLHWAIDERWYRIPLRRAPARLAADYLAFYQTAAFPPQERWMIKWIAPVRGYFVAARRELIPAELDHPRASEQYFRVEIGNPIQLPRPIPSRRLRRITFIPTTLGRLFIADEINDLWIRNSAQERLWKAFQQAGLDAEGHYPLQDDVPQFVADFALFCQEGRIAVIVEDLNDQPSQVGDGRSSISEYLATAAGWVLFRTSTDALAGDLELCVRQVAMLVDMMGGIAHPTMAA